MALLMLILQIVQIFPALITTIEKIMQIIDELEGAEKRSMRADFLRLLQRHKNKIDHLCASEDECKLELDAFAHYMSEKYGELSHLKKVMPPTRPRRKP